MTADSTTESSAGATISTLGVVIVTHNHEDDLPRCLDSLASASSGMAPHIIVRDCGSTDASVDIARRHELRPRIIEGQNIGFGAAVNEAVVLLGDCVSHVLVLNPDVEMGSSLVEIRTAAERIGPFGCVGIRQLSPEGSLVSAWDEFPGVRLEWRKAFRARLYQRSPRAYADDRRVDWIMGAFLLLPRAVFDEVGGFDTRYFLFYEEVDLCRRLAELDHPVWYLSGPHYMHKRLLKDTRWREVARWNSRRRYDERWLSPAARFACRCALTVRWAGDVVAPRKHSDRAYALYRCAATWNILRAEVVAGDKQLRWAWQRTGKLSSA